jgi:hypothetical protein
MDGKLSLLPAILAFFAEHRWCGQLDGGVTRGRVWMSCTCGAGWAQGRLYMTQSGV